MCLIGFSFDFIDGFIARKFKLTSDFGNILDKIIDKLTQHNILLSIIYSKRIINVF